MLLALLDVNEANDWKMVGVLLMLLSIRLWWTGPGDAPAAWFGTACGWAGELWWGLPLAAGEAVCCWLRKLLKLLKFWSKLLLVTSRPSIVGPNAERCRGAWICRCAASIWSTLFDRRHCMIWLFVFGWRASPVWLPVVAGWLCWAQSTFSTNWYANFSGFDEKAHGE